jgi:hypothetical protein
MSKGTENCLSPSWSSKIDQGQEIFVMKVTSPTYREGDTYRRCYSSELGQILPFALAAKTTPHLARIDRKAGGTADLAKVPTSKISSAP